MAALRYQISSRASVSGLLALAMLWACAAHTHASAQSRSGVPLQSQTQGRSKSQAGQVGMMAVRPTLSKDTTIWQPKRASKSACIPTDRIGGVVVVDHKNLDVILRNGQRYRMTLAQSCSQLSYYGGFYYNPTQAGRFCAGKDEVMARSGGACRVAKIAELRRVNRKR